MPVFSDTEICRKQSTRSSRRRLLSVAVVVGLSFALVTQGHANTESEVFAPESLGAASEIGTHTATTGVLNGVDYKVVMGHAVFESDIVLGRVDSRGNVQNISTRGLGKTSAIDRWTNGVIPYQFSSDLSDTEISMAKKAISHWVENTAISLIEITAENRDTYKNYVTFEPANGCASYVGMRGGEQQIWISSNCGVGSIIHEIGHAVGLFHEHTRNDRDNFISVNWDNIASNSEFNFEILNAGTTLLGEYDYGSIMHYGEDFFSSNGASTITVLDGVSEIGQRIGLSDKDIRSVNSLYATDLAIAINTRSNENDSRLTTDVQVINQGAMGSRQIELTLDAGTYSEWASVSSLSNWNCTTNNTELLCTLDTLEVGATETITVESNAISTSEHTVSASLIAITQDTDYSNNLSSDTVSASVSSAKNDAPMSVANIYPNSNSTAELGQALPQESTLINSKFNTSNPFSTTAEGVAQSTVSEMNNVSAGALSPAGTFVLLVAGSVFFRLRSIVK